MSVSILYKALREETKELGAAQNRVESLVRQLEDAEKLRDQRKAWCDDIEKAIRVLNASRHSIGVDCSACGTSNDDCLASIYAGRNACCQRCANTDTHKAYGDG